MTLFDLVATLTLDDSDYEQKMTNAEEAAEAAGTKIGNGLKTAGAIAGKAVVAGVGAAVTGVTALTSQAVSAYSEQEQLIGGIETLFKADADTMIKYANDAYKTAGMSASQYMNTAIESSAAMINSLGGDTSKAAEMTNLAITDMSDNVNKMGTSMESIQNAYRGFSRGNFTMLDNLSLGFSGTKEGMQELLDKAQELSGVEYDISSYSDIVQAIHVVQEEMGIAGTTAKEAGDTIQGSAGSMKAAWQNLVVAFASGKDIEGALNNLVNSAEGALNNMLPIIESVLTNIAEGVSKLAPVISERLPVLMEEILPPLIEAINSLLQGLLAALPTLLQVIIEALPSILDTIITAIIDMLPLIVQLGGQLIMGLAEGLIEALPDLIPALVAVIMQIVTMLTNPESIMKLIDVAIRLMVALSTGLINAIPEILKAIPQIILNIVTALIEAIPQLIKSGLDLIIGLATGILSGDAQIIEAIVQIMGSLGDTIGQTIDEALAWGKDLIDNFINGIKAKWGDLKNTVGSMAQTVKDYIGFSEPEKGPLSNFHTYAPDMMNLFIKGIEDNEAKLQSALADTFTFDGAEIVGNVIPTSGVMAINDKNNNTNLTTGDSVNNNAVPVNVNVVLEGDAGKLFTVVKNQNDVYTKANGVSAFAHQE